jgi:hypothetical protein
MGGGRRHGRTAMSKVITRFPVFIRSGMVLTCLAFAVSFARGPVSTRTIIVAAASLCLSVAILSYKAEVDPSEIRVRHLPFYTTRTPMRDVTHLVEEKTLVLVTATSKIPLWGLSLKTRRPLFDILPGRLNVAPKHPKRRTDSATVVRRHMRRTLLVAVTFVVSLGLSIPFLKGNPWNVYVDAVGKYVLFFCFFMFLLVVIQAGFTYVLWSRKRAFDKLERELADGRLIR